MASKLRRQANKHRASRAARSIATAPRDGQNLTPGAWWRAARPAVGGRDCTTLAVDYRTPVDLSMCKDTTIPRLTGFDALWRLCLAANLYGGVASRRDARMRMPCCRNPATSQAANGSSTRHCRTPEAERTTRAGDARPQSVLSSRAGRGRQRKRWSMCMKRRQRFLQYLSGSTGHHHHKHDARDNKNKPLQAGLLSWDTDIVTARLRQH